MKLKFALASLILVSAISCEVLDEAAKVITEPTTTTPALTNAEVISGLKEALNVGIQNSVSLTSVTDGFLNNADIRLPFPPDALKIKEKALEWGMTSQVEKIETTLNRAAEEATKEALPIFKEAILNMSVQDGFAILNGGNGAATKFLKDNTRAKLVVAFAPKAEEAINKVKLTEYWNPVATKYNQAMKVTGGAQIEADLKKYVTERAIDGLFHMVEIEENKIRTDPAARITDILTKVFGSLTK